MSRRLALTLALLATAALWAASASAEDPLIPREVLFGNPSRVQPELSPDGARLAYLAPVEGVLNIWVAEGTDPDRAKPVTQDKGRGILGYSWAYTNRHILYTQDQNGDENNHVYCLDLGTGEVKDLTPFPGVQARIQGVSHKRPEEILVGINNRNPQLHDIHRVNLLTGARELLFENKGFLAVVTDDDYALRAGVTLKMAAGGFRIVVQEFPLATPPRTILEIGPEDSQTTGMLGLDAEEPIAYLLDSRGRDTAALAAMDLRTGETRILAEDPRCDVSGVVTDPRTHRPLAYSATYERTEWRALDPSIAGDLARLAKLCKGEPTISSGSFDNRRWIVADVTDDGPVRYSLYDRDSGSFRFLFSHRPELERARLAKMRPVRIKTRDGLEMVCYLTLPRWSDPSGRGRPGRPLPTVLWIHGGPWARDSWGYDPIHQWLANRGYAVLSVNYRGSTGFGKAFINAANGEWGRKMHRDVVDAACWLTRNGIADSRRIAIAGGSYGGYETLAALTMTPTRFACGVDICGPSDLLTFLRNVPEYWMPVLPLIVDRVGDAATEEGRAMLTDRSPLTHVARIRKPLLIGQGANDPRVKQSESDQIVQAMRERGIPVAYVLFPDEGHGFAKPANSIAFWALMENFLSGQLGGRAQPVDSDLERSSGEIRAGEEWLMNWRGQKAFLMTVPPDDTLYPSMAPEPGEGEQGPGYAYQPVGGQR